jgi:hypothetical protein
MKNIHHIVNRARLRLQLNAMLDKSASSFLALAIFLVLLCIGDRIGQSQFVPWDVVWILSGFVIGAVLIANWCRAAVSQIEAASEIDSRLQLRDRVSSALTSEHAGTPYANAVIQDATAIVETKKVASSIPSTFPITFPRRYMSVFFAAVVFTGVFLTGQWMWIGGSENVPLSNQVATNESIEASIDVVLEKLQNDDLLSQSLEEELNKLASTGVDETIDSETFRREALKNITDVQKRLDDLMQDEDSLAFEEMQRRMQALEMPKLSNMQPMVADMKNGKFDEAKQEFKKLQEQLESDDLSEEEKEQLKKALEDLAEQLRKLSESSDALSSALASAGMNSNFSDNLDAAAKAVQNAKDLTEEQKKKLLEMIKSQQQASKMCQNMSKSCKSCANGKPSDGMENELAKLNAMKMFKTEAEMAKNACQNAAQGMCTGSGSGKEGTGGSGEGNGGQNPLQETETTSIAQKSPVQTLEGTIIARQLFEGGLLTTRESTATVRETVLAQKRDSEQAIVDEEVPRRYHDLLRHYFGQLEELTEPSDEDDAEDSE